MDRTTWKLAGNSPLLSRSWDGEHVVYHPAAGDTHLLGDAAAQALVLLQAQPAGGVMLAADLATELAGFCSPEESVHAVELTGAILTDLEALGLIERTSP